MPRLFTHPPDTDCPQETCVTKINIDVAISIFICLCK